AEGQVGVDAVSVRMESDRGVEVPPRRLVPVGTEIRKRERCFDEELARRAVNGAASDTDEKDLAPGQLCDHAPLEDAVRPPPEETTGVGQQAGAGDDQDVGATEEANASDPSVALARYH